MSDPRLILFDGQVAHAALRGKVSAKSFTAGKWQRCRLATSNLTRTDGKQDKQLLFGERFLVISKNTEGPNGLSFGQCERDGYVGWMPTADLCEDFEPSHRVTSLGTHLYTAPDIKAPTLGWLPMGAELRVDASNDDTSAAFIRMLLGDDLTAYVPRQHLNTPMYRAKDPVLLARRFLNAPYLWAGDSFQGIDCSGLVQRALLMCGIPCPRDSDQQETALGRALKRGETPNRGDIVFWKGHVGIMASATHLIHANAHHMAVAIEPFKSACTRIGKNEFGAVTSIRRLAP